MLVLILRAQALGEFPPESLIAKPIQTYEPTGRDALFMPTDIAVSPNGVVFVADGVNHRVVEFAANGSLSQKIRQVGDYELQNPVGLDLDEAGRLWIADSELGLVFARGKDGSLERVLNPPSFNGRPDITDVAVSTEANVVWIVDNDGHRILRFNLASESWDAAFPENSRSELIHHPFMADTFNDRLYVSDVINGRVRTMIGSNTIGTTLGKYGLGPGQFVRPKGVACDREGRVWVADGVIGSVQIFSPDDSSFAVLCDQKGDVVSFASPCGVAIRDDQLYVVEMAVHRVRQFQFGEVLLQQHSGATTPQTAGRAQPQQCTVCHVDWIASFKDSSLAGRADLVPSTPDQLLASQERICLSCHDGSVVDSRKRVWQSHGHVVGIEPPSTMKIPQDLPLVNGKLACRTCHSAHTHGGSGQSMENAVFLRVDESPDQLCVRCHTDQQGPMNSGFHPSGTNLFPIPQELVRSRAIGGSPKHVTGCLVCHSGHGTTDAHLVVAPPSKLCLSCHERLNSDWFAQTSSTLSEHRSDQPGMDQLLSSGDTMPARSRLDHTKLVDCLACHRLHHGQDGRTLLATTQQEGSLCLDCHDDYDLILDSPHDLKSAVSTELGESGPTPIASPCRACHGIHQPMLEPKPTAIDPSGRCVSCHRSDGLAHDLVVTTVAHPLGVSHPVSATESTLESAEALVTCRSCHNPHDPENGRFLRDKPDTLCSDCHSKQGASLAGVHDFSADATKKNALGHDGTATGKCGFCHSVHQGTKPVLWSATRNAPTSAEALCKTCHSTESAFSALIPEPSLHPFVSLTDSQHAHNPLPLFNEKGQRAEGGAVSCATCHDPHANSQLNPKMLRIPNNGDDPALCITCHPETAGLQKSMHAQNFMHKYSKHDNICGPCHTMHGQPRKDVSPSWAGPIGQGDWGPTTRLCIGCHNASGGLEEVHFKNHPVDPLRIHGMPTGQDTMPLVGTDSSGLYGHIACTTCHTPHGRVDLADLPISLNGDWPSLLSATKPMLRPFNPPNVCTTCHGFDGLRNFLHYHDWSGGAPLRD